MDSAAFTEEEGLAPAMRRAHERTLMEVEVTMQSHNNFWTGVTNDISEGGVFVAIDDPPAVGRELGFELRLEADGPSWQVIGVVRWVRTLEAACNGYPAGCGLEWFFIPPRALAAIAAFVARRETVFFDD